jgi:opacity protein-like surface antigen
VPAASWSKCAVPLGRGALRQQASAANVRRLLSLRGSAPAHSTLGPNVDKKIVAILFLALPATCAIAGDFYAGVRGGVANFSSDSNNSQGAYGVLAGYSVIPTFSIEAEYGKLGGFNGNGPIAGDVFKGSEYALSGLGVLPLNQNWDCYAKLGVAWTSLLVSAASGSAPFATGSDINRTGVAGGIGTDYKVTRNVAIRLSFDSYRVGGPRTSNVVGALEVGFLYRF